MELPSWGQVWTLISWIFRIVNIYWIAQEMRGGDLGVAVGPAGDSGARLFSVHLFWARFAADPVC